MDTAPTATENRWWYKLISCTRRYFTSLFHWGWLTFHKVSTTCCFLKTDRPQSWFLTFKNQWWSSTSTVRLKTVDRSTSSLIFSDLQQAACFTETDWWENPTRDTVLVRLRAARSARIQQLGDAVGESGFVCVHVSGALRFYILRALRSGVDFLALRSRPSGLAGSPSVHGGERRGEFRGGRHEDVPHQSCSVTESLNTS